MVEKEFNYNIDNGSIRISNDVLSTIAANAAMSVEGVLGMTGNLAGGITELLGKKNPTKGIKVEIKDQDVFLELHLNLAYGVRLNEVGREVQKTVKTAIESMTDLTVKETTVFIEGIGRAKSDKEEAETK